MKCIDYNTAGGSCFVYDIHNKRGFGNSPRFSDSVRCVKLAKRRGCAVHDEVSTYGRGLRTMSHYVYL